MTGGSIGNFDMVPHMRRGTRRGRPRGVTLVEMLVVIAIIGILAGLLLPAIQGARESARLSSCGNNLKQLAVGLHAYHDVNRMFPYGGSSTPPAGGSLYNWRALILPHIEETNVYNELVGGGSVDALVLPILQCPSDPVAGRADVPHCGDGSSNVQPNGAAATASYFGSAGPEPSGLATTPCITFGTVCSRRMPEDRPATSWLGNLAPNGKPVGIFGLSSANVSIDEVRDGESLTLLLGEEQIGFGSKTQIQGIRGWLEPVSMTSTVYGINVKPSSADSADLPKNQRFGSSHQGGAQFALVDGAVRFVKQSIDLELFQLLGNKSDAVGFFTNISGTFPVQLPR